MKLIESYKKNVTNRWNFNLIQIVWKKTWMYDFEWVGLRKTLKDDRLLNYF